jgi:hypothetical protein
MANRQITHAIYNALVVAFRERPENHKHAAAMAGVNWRTARRGWEYGWAPRLAWAPAIKLIIKNEQHEARAKLIVEQAQKETAEAKVATTTPTAVADKAREDAISARVNEARMVRAARENTLVLMLTEQPILKALKAVGERLGQVLAAQNLPRAEAANLFRKVAGIIRETNESAKLSLQMERLLVGAPTDIIGFANVSMEDAERETRRTLELLQQAKTLGVIPSGEGSTDGEAGPNGEPAAGGNGSAPIVH